MMQPTKKFTRILLISCVCLSLQSNVFISAAFLNTPITSTATATKSSSLSTTKSRTRRTNNNDMILKNSIGDIFSGISGIAPSNNLLDTKTSSSSSSSSNDNTQMTRTITEGTSIDMDRDNVDLKCVYKASVDGWSAVDFHRCCDNRGSGLVVGLSKSGKKFGGFNPLGWSSTDDYGSSNAAFLWFVSSGNSIVKCPVLTGGNAAIFDYATGGPQFGSADLIIGIPQAAIMGGFAGPDMEDTTINAGNLKQGKSSVGTAYEFTKGWPMRGAFNLVELEVYCNGNIEPRPVGSGGGGGFNLWPF